MATRYTPIHLQHAPVPRVSSFALLAGLEAGVRGIMISVMPLTVYRAFDDAAAVSLIYFAVGIVSLICGLMVPPLTRFIPRRWMYTVGTGMYLLGLSIAIFGPAKMIAFALMFNALGTVTIFICLNAYVLDYISRADLGRCQSMTMVYSATSWALGPVCGVWLMNWWAPAPFIVAACFAAMLLLTFWILRLGNGKQISRASGQTTRPLAYLGRFFRQPRLIVGWVFAVVRSCGWWVYVVYLPIFCIESGLGDKVAGVALSCSNALLYLSPVMLRYVQRSSLRVAVRGAFVLCSGCFIAASVAAPLPWLTVALMMSGSVFLVLLDVCGGLPFLMAVKPSERTEMSAVYSSFRDVSGILTPGVAWLVLLVVPVAGVFAACGVGLFAAWAIAGRLHPRLGVSRPSHGREFSNVPAE
ncbi:MFS transporter [Pseudogemmobacter sp. W21_MBD1_M6]|uniref:MFS transporter n=1 Tax=Pseudogemmobacter sp. W21_MBD1_M6 TaxID=3240271 RepID=UPI003F9BA8AE